MITSPKCASDRSTVTARRPLSIESKARIRPGRAGTSVSFRNAQPLAGGRSQRPSPAVRHTPRRHRGSQRTGRRRDACEGPCALRGMVAHRRIRTRRSTSDTRAPTEACTSETCPCRRGPGMCSRFRTQAYRDRSGWKWRCHRLQNTDRRRRLRLPSLTPTADWLKTALLHVADDAGGEFAGADLGGARGLPLEVVGYEFLLNGLLHCCLDHLGSFFPADEVEHHDAGEDDRARIDDVLVGILGRSAMSSFEDGVAIANVGAGSDAEAADLGRSRVGDVIAV